MTGIRVTVVRGGHELDEEIEHLTPEELQAGVRPGGWLHPRLGVLLMRVVGWVSDLADNLPYILAHMTPGEISAFAREHGRAWAAFEMMHSIAMFRDGPMDEHRREFDQDGRLHIYAGGGHHVYERSEQIGPRIVWQYRPDLSGEEG